VLRRLGVLRGVPFRDFRSRAHRQFASHPPTVADPATAAAAPRATRAKNREARAPSTRAITVKHVGDLTARCAPGVK
jgi:hypothetical protein